MMYRSTRPRCRAPSSGPVVLLLVERMEPAFSARARAWTRDHRGFLQQVLHRVARLRLVQQEGGLSLVESKLPGPVDPEPFVVCGERPNRREELGEGEAAG